MADDLKLVIGVDYSDLTSLIKTSEQTKRVLRSASSDFAKTGNQKQYMHSINKIVQAQKQLDASSRMTRSQIMKLGVEMQQEVKFTDELTRATNRLGVAMNTSKNKMNGNNMAIQQLGYQVGDFAVQVQGGTSAFVAFSQQGAQLAGMLPMIAGPLGLTMGAAVGLSAALGILIPIGSAVGRMFFEMKDSAKEAAKEAETLDDKLKSLKSTLKDYANTLAAMKAGVSLDELFATRGIDKAKKDLAEAEATLKEFSTNAALVSKGAAGGIDLSFIFGSDTSKYEAALEAVTAAKKVLADLEAKEGDERAKNSQESIAALNQELVLLATKKKYGEDSPQAVNKELEQELRNREAAIDARVKANELDAASGQALKRLARQAAAHSVQIKINTELEKNRLESIKLASANLEKQIKLRKDHAEAVKKIRDAVDAEKKSMGDTIALNQLILKHGKDSLQVKVEEAKQARDKYELDQMSKGILGLHLIDAMNLYDINVALTDQQKRQAEYQKTINGLLAQNQVFVNSLNEASDKARDKAEKHIKLVAQLEEKYGEALVTALALAGVDLSSMSDFIKKAVKDQSKLEGLGETYVTQLDKVNAQIKALKEGKNAEVAAFIAGEKAKISALYESSKAFAMKTKDIVALAEASLAFLAAMNALDALSGAKTELAGMKPTGSKGGGGNVIDINEIIEARKLQVEQERVLIGLSGEQHEAQKIYYELLKENEKADVQVTETKLKNSADYIAAKLEENRVLEEAKAQQQQIADTIESSMEDAFMSIVDGTKSTEDAFKDMARMIIKELYKVLVVQQLVGSFEAGGGGILGSIFGAFQADGGAWQGGSQIQAYANGGVVGSPTTFPMAGGKTGLMGEAGPEAIMPLKRGANGKLGVQMEGGGGDNVVIHQNFNFQANGDESVKKLIAQAAPQIANMTKSSMLNDRRRGGATKAVFG